MDRSVERVNGELVDRTNLRFAPARLSFPFNFKQMVSAILPKSKLTLREFSRVGIPRDFKISVLKRIREQGT
jgi:hypothetical protein